MELNEESLCELNRLLDKPSKVVILSHTNPDGDAIGSSLAWGAFLETKGHQIRYIVPNKYPGFLAWMPFVDKVTIYKENPIFSKTVLEDADIIFCLDFNQISRLEGLGQAVSTEKAKFVLIDHHLDPPADFDIIFSHPESCSTSYLVYKIIKSLAGVESVTREMAVLLYVGIMTDTGNFSYSHLTSDLFRSVAEMVDKGIDIPRINQDIYNSFTPDRVHLLGYALSKMEVMNVEGTRAAYMSLTEAELRKFHFQQGDSEGFVNYPLSIRGIDMSAIFIQTRNFIRVSLRSRGDVDVSLFAKLYFEGGGHKNAAGGKSHLNMKETEEKFRRDVTEFFHNHYPSGITTAH